MSIIRHRKASGKPSPASRAKPPPLPAEVRRSFMSVYSAILDLWASAAAHARPPKVDEVTLKAEGARRKLMALERSVYRMGRE